MLQVILILGLLSLIAIRASGPLYFLMWFRRIKSPGRLGWAIFKQIMAIPLIPVFVLLFFLSKRLFLRAFSFFWLHLDVLNEEGVLYLRRFFLTPKTKHFRPWFIHYIAKSDVGRDPHDHPGKFTTWPLSSGYLEQIYKPLNQKFRDMTGLFYTREVRPGMCVENSVGHTHMVILDKGPAWTLVRAWIRGKPWGFWILDDVRASADRWVESEEYGVKGEEVRSWE
jgi:hypothetical protein